MGSNRREFIARTGAAIAALSSLAACAKRATAPAIEELLAGIAEELLAEYPENATALGLDSGARAGLKSRLTDRSLAGQQAIAEARCRRGWRSCRAIDAGHARRRRPDRPRRRRAPRTRSPSRASRFPYGDVALSTRNGPTATRLMSVAQNTGAFVEIPDFLDSNHAVESAADAEAYLARLEAYAGRSTARPSGFATMRRDRRGRARFPARQDASGR